MKYLGTTTDNKDLINKEYVGDLTNLQTTVKNSIVGAINEIVQGGGGGGGTSSGIPYGVCNTTANTQAKTVTIEGIASLTEGLTINVLFVNGQTYNGVPTLNLNSLGAKNIRSVGGVNATQYEWAAGEILTLVYNGTYWVISNGRKADTTYYGFTKLSSSVNSTSTSLAATPSAVKQAYDLAQSASDLAQSSSHFDWGVYQGTGVHGASNPNSITCNFTPKVVLVYEVGGLTEGTAGTFTSAAKAYMIYFEGATSYQYLGTAGGVFSVSDNTFTWYHTSSNARQLNDSSTYYLWVAFG